MSCKFIRTSDVSMADKLRRLGFMEMPKAGSVFVFVNSNTVTFSESDRKRISFTDRINF